MKRFLVLLTVILVVTTSVTSAQKLADPILLWPAGAPGATGDSDEDKPAVIPFIPDEASRNGTAVLVIPGGGNTIRAVDHEGVLIAQWLKEHGITAFLLRYRLRPLYERKDWVKDGQRAMQFIRSNAAQYHITSNHVGAIGFSAGATLIVDMTLSAPAVSANDGDPLERIVSRPDFMILGYGAMRLPEMADSVIKKRIPPTFMYGTVEDRSSQGGMIDLYTRLYRAGVPLEGHFFQNGIHGTGFALGDPVLGQWTTLLHNWLKVGGFLKNQSQVPLNGVVKLDGAPLIKGMVILTPVKDENAPPVIVYINNTGTGALGRFLVPKNQGPVEGKYAVEVRQDATRWTSNSREPFMIQMMGKQSKNALTEEDLKAWGDYTRKRDLSPSIDHQRVYARQHPADKKPHIIDIKNGQDVVIEVFSK